MEAKIYILCLLPILFVAYSDAVKCYECTYSSYEVAGTSGEDGDDGCKDGDDISNTISCDGACTKIDFKVTGDVAGQDFEMSYLNRDCAPTVYGQDTDKCYDIEELFTSEQLQGLIGSTFPPGSAINVDTPEGEACLCDDDKCNSASSFTAGVVVVFATLVGYLMKNYKN